jgi:hypothetical protein
MEESPTENPNMLSSQGAVEASQERVEEAKNVLNQDVEELTGALGREPSKEEVGDFAEHRQDTIIKEADADGLRTPDEAANVLLATEVVELAAVDEVGQNDYAPGNAIEKSIKDGHTAELVEGVRDLAEGDPAIAEKAAQIIDESEKQEAKLRSMNDIDPYEKGADGLTKAAITGIEGGRILRDDEPVPRYEGLSEEQSAIQEAFCEWWEDPEKREEALAFADKIAQEGAINGVPVYETDGLKQLDAKWGAEKRFKELQRNRNKTQEERAEYGGYLQYRQENNTVLHQAANAIAKAAFERAAAKVDGDILFTSGGCASGKGFGLEQAANGHQAYASLGEKLETASLIWDAAGDQCGTELGWVQSLVEPGSKLHVVHTDADPSYIATNPKGGLVERATKKGRMVDTAVYALSHFIGTQNLLEFIKSNYGNPDVSFTFYQSDPPKDKATGKYKYGEGVYPDVSEINEFTGSAHKPTTASEVADIIRQANHEDFGLLQADFESVLKGAVFIEENIGIEI